MEQFNPKKTERSLVDFFTNENGEMDKYMNNANRPAGLGTRQGVVRRGDAIRVPKVQGDSIPDFTASDILSSKLWQPRPDRPPHLQELEPAPQQPREPGQLSPNLMPAEMLPRFENGILVRGRPKTK